MAAVTLGDPTSSLNARREPGTDGAILGAIRHGAVVIVMKDMGNGWAYVDTGYYEAYVKLEYLTPVEGE